MQNIPSKSEDSESARGVSQENIKKQRNSDIRVKEKQWNTRYFKVDVPIGEERAPKLNKIFTSFECKEIVTIDQRLIEQQKKFEERKAYGKAALKLVTRQKKETAKPAERQAEKENAGFKQAMTRIQDIWEEKKIAICHRAIVFEILNSINEDDAAELANAECVLLEKDKAFPQKVDRFFRMREKCIGKIKELEQDHGRLDLEVDDQSHILAQVESRLSDLRMISLSLVEAVANWDSYMNYLLAFIDEDKQRNLYFVGEDGKQIFDLMIQQMFELYQLNVCSRYELDVLDIVLMGDGLAVEEQSKEDHQGGKTLKQRMNDA